MKKTIIIIMLFCCLASTASAFVPLLIPAWVYGPTAAMAVSTAAIGLYYGMNSGAVPDIDVGANIKIAASAIYAHMDNGSPILATIALNAKISKAAMLALINAKPEVYPILVDALKDAPQFIPVPDVTAAMGVVGNRVNIEGGNYLVDSVAAANGSVYYTCDTWSPPAITSSSGTPNTSNYVFIVSGWQGGAGCGDKTRVDMHFGTYLLPLPTPKTTENIVDILANPGYPGGPAKAPYQAEIDKLFQDPNYIPVFTDTTTGLPWLPPAGVLSPGELAAWNTAGAAQQARELAAAQAAAAAGVAASGAAQALIRSQAADVILAADPTNPVKIAEAERLRALSNTAATTAAITSAASAAAAVPVAQAAVVPAVVPMAPAVGVPALPARKSLDLAPFIALNGVLASTYPFNLPASVGSYYSKLVVTGHTAPVFDLPMFGTVYHVDLAIFNPVATLCRYLMGMLISCGILLYIIHFFRGIS